MFYDVVKGLSLALFIYLICTRILRPMIKQYNYQKGGVAFASITSPITDLFDFLKVDAENPKTELNLFKTFYYWFGPKLPDILGYHIMGNTFMSINSVKLLETIYVTKNSVHSKHPWEQELFNRLMPNSLFLMRTENPHYSDKRKILSAAFFKKKLLNMVNTIKFTTI